PPSLPLSFPPSLLPSLPTRPARLRAPFHPARALHLRLYCLLDGRSRAQPLCLPDLHGLLPFGSHLRRCSGLGRERPLPGRAHGHRPRPPCHHRLLALLRGLHQREELAHGGAMVSLHVLHQVELQRLCRQSVQGDDLRLPGSGGQRLHEHGGAGLGPLFHGRIWPVAMRACLGGDHPHLCRPGVRGLAGDESKILEDDPALQPSHAHHLVCGGSAFCVTDSHGREIKSSRVALGLQDMPYSASYIAIYSCEAFR
ncbi:hypothetical protein Naga_100337g1, partial [Nannochloropsis gaditana]